MAFDACNAREAKLMRKTWLMEAPAGLFGALEVAQRQYDLRCEVEAYLKDHPRAAVVNLAVSTTPFQNATTAFAGATISTFLT